jgi:hypothetical protein
MFALPRPTPDRAPGLDRLGQAARLERALALLRAIGPYVAIELILPGGTLIALVCFLVRRKCLRARSARVGSSEASLSGTHSRPQYFGLTKWLREGVVGADGIEPPTFAV